MYSDTRCRVVVTNFSEGADAFCALLTPSTFWLTFRNSPIHPRFIHSNCTPQLLETSRFNIRYQIMDFI
jgi:hypothetical protein